MKSPIPSPPLAPGSPNFPRRVSDPPSPTLMYQMGGANSTENSQSTSLYQHLQRLHLHQQIQGANQPYQRGSPPTGCLPLQRTDSPPQIYHQLLHNATLPQQRASPPPPLNYQNLHMIKEDSQDNPDHVLNEDVAMDDASVSASGKRAGKPLISITDTQGHVVDVNSDVEGSTDFERRHSGGSESSVGSGQFRTFHTSPPGGDTNSPSPPTHPHSPTHRTLHQCHSSPASPHHHSYHGYMSNNYSNNTYPSVGQVAGHMTVRSKSHSLPDPQCIIPLAHQNYTSRSQQLSSTKFSQDHLRDFNIMGLSHVVPPLPVNHGTDQEMEFSSNENTKVLTGNGSEIMESNGLYQTVGSSINLTSTRPVDYIMGEIKRILVDKETVFQCSNNLFRMENSGVQMELEICQGQSYNGLQVRRISGDKGHYRQLCQELLAGINL